jgi:hypothetical protein
MNRSTFEESTRQPALLHPTAMHPCACSSLSTPTDVHPSGQSDGLSHRRGQRPAGVWSTVTTHLVLT